MGVDDLECRGESVSLGREMPIWPVVPVDTGTVANAVRDVFKDDGVVGEAIARYLKDSLPETEDRIKTPMDPNCEVAVVIPAYGEWDYIFRPLESLSKQKGVKPDQYEVIVVVNNPAKPPVAKEGETPTFYAKRLDHYKQAACSNRKTIELIKYINGESVDLDLTPAEREKADNIRRSGLKFFCVDKASVGKVLEGEDANVGGARNRGVAEAVERFYSIGKNGIVAQTDADTSCDPWYVHEWINAFRKSPDVVVMGGMVECDGSSFSNELLKLASLHRKLNSRYDRMLKILLEKRGLKSNEIEVKGEALSDGFSLWGSNMASRAFETAEVSGVPKLPYGEDGEFGRNLSKVGKISIAPKVKVVTADRLSAVTEGGLGSGKLRLADSIAEKGAVFVPDPEQLVSGGAVSEISLEEASAKVINMFCEDEQVRCKYEQGRAGLIAEEDRWREIRMQVVDALLDMVFGDEKNGIDVDSLVRTIEFEKKRLAVDIAEDEFLGDLCNGVVVSKKFVEIVNVSETREDAITELKKVFVEDLNPLNRNPLFLKSLELKALYNAVQ